MIKRRYFYYCILQDAVKPQFANGILIVTSWLPNQSAAFDAMYKNICDQTGYDKSKIECRAFNAV